MIKINNKTMRALWLQTNGLSRAPTGALDIMKIIKQLGFVQLDTIQNVSRAHHHIIWSRNQNYKEFMLDELLKSKQNIFEHFTHDASVLPIDFYPMWQRQFARKKQKLNSSNFYKNMPDNNELEAIKLRIKNEGALSTHAFDSKITNKQHLWARPPHKIALDHMWYCGELSTSHREKFIKFYDLTKNIIPKHILEQNISDDEQLNWLCMAALERLGIGTLKEIKCFWEAANINEVKIWAQQTKLNSIKWQAHDGKWHDAFALNNIEQRLEKLNPPTSRLRIINPFDPAIRDRARLKNIFGLDYKIEIFVPKEKRKWGYYVYPLLEGNKFIGRIDLKAERKKSILNVINFWQEPNIKWNEERNKKLNTELQRLAKFANLKTLHYHEAFVRQRTMS